MGAHAGGLIRTNVGNEDRHTALREFARCCFVFDAGDRVIGVCRAQTAHGPVRFSASLPKAPVIRAVARKARAKGASPVHALAVSGLALQKATIDALADRAVAHDKAVTSLTDQVPSKVSDVLDRAKKGDPRAQLAVATVVNRARAGDPKAKKALVQLRVAKVKQAAEERKSDRPPVTDGLALPVHERNRRYHLGVRS